MSSVTIITVCFNAEDTISNTIGSVLIQDYSNIEYLIIDGKSTDNTLNLVEEFVNKDNRIRYISEKDCGIYDAMNKGISNSKGDVLFFLNSGDEFYDSSVISDIINQFELDDIDIIYGDIVKRNNSTSFIEQQKQINQEYLLDGKMICHQSIFAKRSAFSIVGKFNLKYKISADFDWLLRGYLKGLNIKYFPRIISYYDIDGLSAKPQSRKIVWKERENIIYKNFGVKKWIRLLFNQRFIRRMVTKLNASKG